MVKAGVNRQTYFDRKYGSGLLSATSNIYKVMLRRFHAYEIVVYIVWYTTRLITNNRKALGIVNRNVRSFIKSILASF